MLKIKYIKLSIIYSVDNGSTISMCSIDLSKAFDRMNHSAYLLS